MIGITSAVVPGAGRGYDWCRDGAHLPALIGKFQPIYPIPASTGCIYAGNDLQMPGCEKNVQDIIKAVKTGEETDGVLNCYI